MGIQIPKRKATQRIRDFKEVVLGYNKRQALAEAKRCLQCKKPLCQQACPLKIDIPRFIRQIREGKIKEAYSSIRERNPFPGICGRVCPQEKLCEKACILSRSNQSINIGNLERFVFDEFFKEYKKVDEEIERELSTKIAVIGTGPAGLAAAFYLRKKGFKVFCFEALHRIGGVLVYGIPSFRLPREVLNTEISMLKKMGVIFVLNTLVGRTIDLYQLFREGFKRVIIATGAGLPKLLNIKGEDLNGIYSANEFLIRVNLMEANLFPKKLTPLNIGRRTIIIGGGNVALDCARVALRLKSQALVCYRRIRELMPARIEEIRNAEEEGVEFKWLLSPKEFKGKERLKSVIFEKMKLDKRDSSNRPRPLPTGEFVEIKTDTVIVAIGQSPNPLIYKTHPDLETIEGRIKVNEKLETSMRGVYAAGDIVTGEATVVEAIAQGMLAACNLIDSL